MFFRNTALSAALVVLTVAVVAGAAGAARDRSAPTNLRITATTDYSISMAWDAPTGRSGGNWWYCVQRDHLGCFRVNPPQTTFTMSGLMPDTTFNYSVLIVDSRGHRSASTNTVTYTTPPDTQPPAPAPVLSQTYLRPTRIGVSWTGSTDNTSQVWHTLYVNGEVVFRDYIGTRSWLLFYLTPETTYEFKVTARDRYFNTVESNVLSVTTPATTDTTPPTAPTNLTFPGMIENEIWANWDASTDDTDPQSEILYDFYLNGELTHDGGFGTSGIAYCRSSGPTVVVVKAVDSSGNISEPSNELLVNCP